MHARAPTPEENHLEWQSATEGTGCAADGNSNLSDLHCCQMYLKAQDGGSSSRSCQQMLQPVLSGQGGAPK